MDFSKIGRGVIYWPVGCGDSSTIVVDENTILQIDLNNRADSEDDDTPYTNIIDELKTSLNKNNGKPYLNVFVLTHPDEDHCKGFEELLNNVTIGELWFTPRVFKEYKKDLCKDAVAFQKEANRRIEKLIKNNGSVSSGDRIKLFGYDELIGKDGDYAGFPKSHLAIPGTSFNTIDGNNLDAISIFAHSPFKDEMDGDRNDTSLAFQTILKKNKKELKLLHFGDLSSLPLFRIFESTKDKTNLHWNVLLAPHHCSKSATHYSKDNDSAEEPHENLIEHLKLTQLEQGYIVSSSKPIPAQNDKHDNPPHAIAKEIYQELVSTAFYCTHEHPDKKNPKPIIFKFNDDGDIEPPKSPKDGDSNKSLSQAVIETRGSQRPSAQKVGFGNA